MAIVISMYVLFLTDRVSPDWMAPQDPEEFLAVTEPKYDPNKNILPVHRLVKLKLKKKQT